MSETQALLARISALRQRLDQSRALTQKAVANTAALSDDWHGPLNTIQTLQRHIRADGQHDLTLDHAVEAIVPPEPPRALPRQLTARARQLLEHARSLLDQLRSLGEAFAPPCPEPSHDPNGAAPSALIRFDDPLARLYRDSAAIADTTLRMIPQLPDSATGQLHLCDGLEGILALVAARLHTLTAAVHQHQHEIELVNRLAALLTAVESGQLSEMTPFTALAEEIYSDAQEGSPLRVVACSASQPLRFVAANSLTVARVLARLLRHDVELKARPLDHIVGALLHDVGMLRVPAAILAHHGPLDDEQRRQVDAHCRAGAMLVQTLSGAPNGLAQAVAGHHERLDGTGYPDGLRAAQLSTLTRLLAVCDCYVSMCSPRPHRPAREPRTALTDTLLLADQGQLDRHQAEHLLQISFYPVGSAVELADGVIGIVVAVASAKHDLNAPARPVVALLLDAEGCAFPLPRYLDLVHSDHHSVVRTLSHQEREEVLGSRFPEWLAA